MYDPVKNTWQFRAALKTPRSGACAVVMEGKIYVMGGTFERGALNSCEVYDPELDVWTFVKSEYSVKFYKAFPLPKFSKATTEKPYESVSSESNLIGSSVT